MAAALQVKWVEDTIMAAALQVKWVEDTIMAAALQVHRIFILSFVHIPASCYFSTG